MNNELYLAEMTCYEFMILPPRKIYTLCKEIDMPFSIIGARLLKLNYDEYLHLCCDKYKAFLSGKTKCPTPHWSPDNKKDGKKLVDELNKYWRIFLEQTKTSL